MDWTKNFTTWTDDNHATLVKITFRNKDFKYFYTKLGKVVRLLSH